MEAYLQSYAGARDCGDSRRYCRALRWPSHNAARWLAERNSGELSAGQKGGLGRTFWEPQDWNSKGLHGSGLRCLGRVAQRPRTAITGGETGHWRWQGCVGEGCAEGPALL